MDHISIRENIIDFMVDWCWTYDPRLPAIGLPAYLPWIPWPRQIEFIEWFYNVYLNQKRGLVEKSRDAGATWLFCLVFLREWRWENGFAGGIGSRKLTLVEDRDNPKAVFTKLRALIERLPVWWYPKGWEKRLHDKSANLINIENDSNIAGEGGDDIGRGDRRSVYLIDEAAFLEHPMMADSALSQTTNSQFDLSTPNGMNHFGQKRHSGRVEVFTFHWKQDERKDQAWYNHEKATLDPVVLAQEVDIDYHASVEGVFIPPKYVQAAVELELPKGGVRSAGLDVAAGGTNSSALVLRNGPYVTTQSYSFDNGVDLVYETIDECNKSGVEYLNYDKIGVGHSVYSTINRTDRQVQFKHFGVLAGGTPSDEYYDEYKKTGKQIFVNARAEWWYRILRRFKKTYEFVNGKAEYPTEELISIENNGNLISQLSSPKKFITENGKIRVESKEAMLKRGIKSPDLADGLVMAFISQNASNKYVWPAYYGAETHKLNIDWEGIQTEGEKSLHYGAIVQLPDLSIWGLSAIWEDCDQRLFIYDAFHWESPVPLLIANTLINRLKMKRFKCDRLMGDEKMFANQGHIRSTGQLIRSEMRKLKSPQVITESVRYDFMGAMTQAAQFFKLKHIFVSDTIPEAANQFASWVIENGKPSTINCGYCKCLCHIISELKRRQKIKPKVPKIPDYNKVEKYSKLNQ